MSVNVINTCDIDREVFGVPWGINGPVPGTIADYSHITGCERQLIIDTIIVNQEKYCFFKIKTLLMGTL